MDKQTDKVVFQSSLAMMVDLYAKLKIDSRETKIFVNRLTDKDG